MHPYCMQMRQYLYFGTSKCVSICTFVLVPLACITAQPPRTCKRLALSLALLAYLYKSATTDSSGLQDGCTPLIYASYCGNADVVRVLSEKGARLEAGDQVRTHTLTHTHKHTTCLQLCNSVIA